MSKELEKEFADLLRGMSEEKLQILTDALIAAVQEQSASAAAHHQEPKTDQA